MKPLSSWPSFRNITLLFWVNPHYHHGRSKFRTKSILLFWWYSQQSYSYFGVVVLLSWTMKSLWSYHISLSRTLILQFIISISMRYCCSEVSKSMSLSSRCNLTIILQEFTMMLLSFWTLVEVMKLNINWSDIKLAFVLGAWTYGQPWYCVGVLYSTRSRNRRRRLLRS